MAEYLEFVSIDFWHIFMSMGNLLILTFIVKKFLFKPVKDIMKKRTEEIESTYTKAKTALSNAESDRDKYSKKIKEAENESDDIIKEAVSKAKIQENLIVTTANKKAEEILKKAELNIEINKKKALISMRDDISNMVIDTASKIIGREVTAEVHNDLINVAIDKLYEG